MIVMGLIEALENIQQHSVDTILDDMPTIDKMARTINGLKE